MLDSKIVQLPRPILQLPRTIFPSKKAEEKKKKKNDLEYQSAYRGCNHVIQICRRCEPQFPLRSSPGAIFNVFPTRIVSLFKNRNKKKKRKRSNQVIRIGAWP